MKTKLFAVLLFSTLAIYVSRAEAQEPQTGPDPAPSPVESLKILGASYSYGGQHADVTERVKDLLREDKIFSANPEWLKVDPHPGMAKALFIFCEIDGKKSMLSVGESEDVSRARIVRYAWAVEARTDAQITVHPKAETEPSESVFAASKEAFPSIETPTSDHGAPVRQTIHLNDKVVERDGQRFSGFRFRVDRRTAAAKQDRADKAASMDFFWYFAMPPGVQSWYIEPVKGTMQRGFDNFFPVKNTTFKNADDLSPKDKSYVVLQRLTADRLKEGEEYIMWFACPSDERKAVDMSVALGYRLDDRNFKDWEDLTDLSRFLGLVPSGESVGKDNWIGRQ